MYVLAPSEPCVFIVNASEYIPYYRQKPAVIVTVGAHQARSPCIVTYVSNGSTAQRDVAHPALRSAALAAQGRPAQLRDDELALAPGAPDETQQFRYSYVLVPVPPGFPCTRARAAV